MLKKIINRICYFIINRTDEKILLNKKWTKLEFILNSKNFNINYLVKYKHIQEVEHQVGRYLNMKKIFDDLESIEKDFIEGDIVEFGTWQGLGLIYFSRFLGKNNNNRKLIGIDSFEGLPHSSTIWEKGDFSNTEINLVRKNISNYSHKEFDDKNVFLIKGWFNDPKVKEELFTYTQRAALIHFDADLYSSTKQALELIEPLVLNSQKSIYFLFDDWGCHQAEVPDAFYEWVEKMKKSLDLTIEKVSNTKYTRYYKLTKANNK
jgi:hypothetical protein